MGNVKFMLIAGVHCLKSLVIDTFEPIVKNRIMIWEKVKNLIIPTIIVKFIIFLFFTTIMTSCDTISPIYLKNETGNSVKIIVKFENRFDIQFDSLRCTNRPVEKFKLIKRDSFEGRISVEKSGSDEYRLEIENHKTILLEPRTFGIPIKKIIFQTQLFTDTILNAYRYRPKSYLKSKLIIERKGLYTHLIILK